MYEDINILKIEKDFNLIKIKMSNHINQHLLYVKSGVSTREQLEECFKSAILEINEKMGRKIECKFKVNLIVGKNGVYFGIGYVWVSNTEIYRILLSLDEYGEKLHKIIPDPSWKPLTEEEEYKLQNNADELDWNELEDLEKRKTGCKNIIEYLKPIVSLPGYKYNEEQMKHIKSISKTGIVQDMGYFDLRQAYITDYVDSHSVDNILYSIKVPKWVSKNFIKNEFINYNSSSVEELTYEYKGEKYTDSVPCVIKDGDSIFVIFDPKTTDARFALLMTKKMNVINSLTEEKETVYFDHAPLKGHQHFKIKPPTII